MTAKRRVIAIGLDGYEQSLGAAMMRRGELPALSRLHETSARFLLDGGAGQRTGLAWEHLSTGLSPEAAGRWGAVHFDPRSYGVWQEGTSLAPFPSRLAARSVVFDAPYFDLAAAPAVSGVVGWGAHDPGIGRGAQPTGLWREFESRFGAYPAEESIYGFTWPSAERCRRLGEALTEATELRSRAARWLFGERFPDWDMALAVVSEPHSATEALWHGIDATHPLHEHPSAEAAAEGVYSVYRATDRLVGELVDAFPDAAVVAFSMMGMGPNRADVPAMALLPELLYRHAFGRPLLRVPERWSDVGALPMLGEDEDWNHALAPLFPQNGALRLGRGVARRLRRALPHRDEGRASVDWMPATRYLPHWRRMPAFAIPAYYDGRVRINLEGRESNGVVPRERYEATCDEIEALLRECRDARTQEPAVEAIERYRGDPMALGPTAADLVIVWRGTAVALDHPRLGRAGPLPFRRPGGHTGAYGMAYVSGAGIAAGDRGVRSAINVAPTLVDLLGEALPGGLSGRSLLDAGAAPPK